MILKMSNFCCGFYIYINTLFIYVFARSKSRGIFYESLLITSANNHKALSVSNFFEMFNAFNCEKVL